MALLPAAALASPRVSLGSHRGFLAAFQIPPRFLFGASSLQRERLTCSLGPVIVALPAGSSRCGARSPTALVDRLPLETLEVLLPAAPLPRGPCAGVVWVRRWNRAVLCDADLHGKTGPMVLSLSAGKPVERSIGEAAEMAASGRSRLY